MATHHLGALMLLAESEDLALVADVHYRQLLEISFQVRRLAMAKEGEREMLAEKISAWGCIDYLDKLKQHKEHEAVMRGYEAVSGRVASYDPDLIRVIERERANRNWYWFGKSITNLVRQVSRGQEDLEALYHLVSAKLHGIWDITLNVTSPKPGVLDFCPYPDKDTLYRWATESVDRTTRLYIEIWNEVAHATGATEIPLRP